MAPRMMRTPRISLRNNHRLLIQEIFRAEITSDQAADMNMRRTRRRIAAGGDLDDTVEATASDLKGKMSVESENDSVEPKNKAAEPPKERVFICSICMDPLVEEMSTMCGHIFCKKCITTAIASKSTCPTCRKYVSMKQLIRVHLSSST